MFRPDDFIQSKDNGINSVYRVLAVDQDGLPLAQLVVAPKEWMLGTTRKLQRPYKYQKVFVDAASLSATRR